MLHGMKNHVGMGFPTDFGLLFTDGKVDERGEEGLVKLLNNGIGLVADDGCFQAECLALLKKWQNASVGLSCIEAMEKIVMAKCSEYSFFQFGSAVRRQRFVNQNFCSIARSALSSVRPR